MAVDLIIKFWKRFFNPNSLVPLRQNHDSNYPLDNFGTVVSEKSELLCRPHRRYPFWVEEVRHPHIDSQRRPSHRPMGLWGFSSDS